MRIVILEDDADQADLLVAWLEEAGHQCTVHKDGNAFIRGYNKDSYDIVLLDWMVPNLTGIEVLKHMRYATLAVRRMIHPQRRAHPTVKNQKDEAAGKRKLGRLSQDLTLAIPFCGNGIVHPSSQREGCPAGGTS